MSKWCCYLLRCGRLRENLFLGVIKSLIWATRRVSGEEGTWIHESRVLGHLSWRRILGSHVYTDII